MAGNLTWSKCWSWRDDDDDNGQEERYRVHTQVNVGKGFFLSNDIRLMECNKKERESSISNMKCLKEAISSGWMARCESLCSLLTFCSEPLTLESWTNRKKQCRQQSYTFSDCASTTYLSEGGKRRESSIRSLIKLHSTLILGVKWTFTCKQERRVKNLHECSSKSELIAIIDGSESWETRITLCGQQMRVEMKSLVKCSAKRKFSDVVVDEDWWWLALLLGVFMSIVEKRRVFSSFSIVEDISEFSYIWRASGNSENFLSRHQKLDLKKKAQQNPLYRKRESVHSRNRWASHQGEKRQNYKKEKLERAPSSDEKLWQSFMKNVQQGWRKMLSIFSLKQEKWKPVELKAKLWIRKFPQWN